MSRSITGIVDWLKNWFYDKDQVNTYLNAKVNLNQGQANYNVVTNSSGNITTEPKPTIPDVSVKADKNGGVQQVTDANAHSNLGTSANATQGAINTAIDSVIGSLSSIQAVKVVSSLPTASASTMGSLYIVSENSKINVYYTEQSGSTYSWHKMDSDILDELSIGWNDITGKPSSFTPSSHTHDADEVIDENYTLYSTLINLGSLGSGFQDRINRAIDTAIGSHDSTLATMDTAINGKAPKNHASSSTTYGLGTTSNYGHNKIRDNLTASSLVNGESLSAHQGYVLKGLIDDLDDAIASFDATTIDFNPSSNIWGEYIQVVSTVAQGLDTLKEITNSLNTSVVGKQDIGDCITSIELVPKSSDNTGAIRLYYGDEP